MHWFIESSMDEHISVSGSCREYKKFQPLTCVKIIITIKQLRPSHRPCAVLQQEQE
jgi:hypothetical protein